MLSFLNKSNYSRCAIFLLLLAGSGACTHSEKRLVDTENIVTIQVNQVAYELSGSKSAIITSQQLLNKKAQAFTVMVGSKNIFMGELVKLPAFNEWNIDEQELFYYRADFSAVKQKGDFTLVINNNNKQIVSPSFAINENALFLKTTQAILAYFNYSRNDERYTWQQDKHIRIFDTERYVDVRGGWNDAGGDTGKYLSHLSYSNFLNPQQLALVGWALAYSYQSVPELYQQLNLSEQVIDEVFWGADYLHRILDDEGYFYMTVFDLWHTNNAERVVTAYVGAAGTYTEDYQAAFRQGAGVAIAALARAAILAKQTKKHGEYSAKQYLADAEKAFRHLEKHNQKYCDDGIENIIDDYTALLAAVELYKATNNHYYLKAAQQRASNLVARNTAEGWFISNAINSDNLRPFYHGAEAGFPVFSLAQYLSVAKDKTVIAQVKSTIKRSLQYQLSLNKQVANPYNYARQPFKTYKNNQLSREFQSGFFIPHANETNYWWQGESARLSSLATAAIVGDQLVFNSENNNLQAFAQNQLDWTLGRNPYNLSMLNGFGAKNPQAYEGLDMVKGGISNGITGAKGSDSGRGIEFGPEPDWQNWRWVEQWLPHSIWFLLATTTQVKK
jgi:hypothetical protein